MPSRNIIKIDIPDSYYHVYARGHSRSEIFIEPEDYAIFLNLLKRYLSRQPQLDKNGLAYTNLYDKLEIICFCLMPNHLHLMLYQRDEGTMQQFMRGVMTSYSRYFNKKYDRSGSVFESRYKASHIGNQSYLEHITRYIHLNPHQWERYPYSSLRFYLGKARAEWLRPERIMRQFQDTSDYLTFIKDYESHKQMLDEIKYELANPIIQ